MLIDPLMPSNALVHNILMSHFRLWRIWLLSNESLISSLCYLALGAASKQMNGAHVSVFSSGDAAEV